MALLSGLDPSEIAGSLHETGVSLHGMGPLEEAKVGPSVEPSIGGEYNVPVQAMAMESAATAEEADDSYLTR